MKLHMSQTAEPAPIIRSPFAKLRALLDYPHGAAQNTQTDTRPIIDLAIGNPQHQPPQFVLDELTRHLASFSQYPPPDGLPIWRTAIRDWLQRRFSISLALLEKDYQILPVNGTREGLFLIPQIDRYKSPHKTHIAMPNPFYQLYAAAALAAGYQPLYLNATDETGFLPDLDSLTKAQLDSLHSFFLCSPTNPQGVIVETHYLDRLLDLAHRHDFLLVIDECYIDIYDQAYTENPPISALQCAAKRKEGAANLIIFQSLSKRSNLPGLRSGFCAGGQDIMHAFLQLRLLVAPQTPIAIQRAAALAWADDAHVGDNRALYQAKMAQAEIILDGHFDFYRPQAGFFLWLKTGNGEMAAQKLWQEAGIRVLPGAYLAQTSTQTNTQANPQTNSGQNPAQAYIRVALVAPEAETIAALSQMRDILKRN